jgi:cytochrome bd-type quinol oxidase subunit 1
MAAGSRSSAWEGYGLVRALVEGWVRRTFGDQLWTIPKRLALQIAEKAIETLQVSGVNKTNR